MLRSHKIHLDSKFSFTLSLKNPLSPCAHVISRAGKEKGGADPDVMTRRMLLGIPNFAVRH